MFEYPLITQTPALEAWCTAAAGQAFVAVDFEFMREDTYFSQLCLIQVATPGQAAVIDPLAPGLSLEPFWSLLNTAPVLKVFHSSSQDIEIVVNKTGRVPHPLFDTQIAAMAIGLGEQVSYQNLIATLLGKTLDKGARFTDWSRRPLDLRQLTYAIGDVTYLAEAYPKIADTLAHKGRDYWLREEMERLANPSHYITQPEDAWRRLKLPGRDLKLLGRVRALAAWREQEAISKDVPRGRILKDETLLEIATHPPKAQADIGRMRGLSEKWSTNDIGGRLFTALNNAPPLPRELLPARSDGIILNKSARQGVDLLKLLLKLACEHEDIAPKLVCRADDLDRLVSGERDLPILEGWRFDVFGRKALDLVDGKLVVHLVDGRLTISPTPADWLESPHPSPQRSDP